jgi:ribosome assembly protein RRB1
MLPEEGFALDISPMIIGRFDCGTLDGKVHVFNPKGDGMSDIIQSDSAIWRTKKSIEDLQFSPNQPDVLAACSADGTVRIFDLRTPFNNISELLIQAHNTDVNVISWNKKAPTLIASGAEDGSFKVWDLRYIGKPAITNIAWHQEQVCSIERQPHDEWTLAVASADNRLSVWDFSVEKDDEETLDPNFEHVPDQLLFLHQGQEDLKEVRWHPVYPNVLMTTALDGYNVFEPAIDEADSEVESPNDLELIPDPIEQ